MTATTPNEQTIEAERQRALTALKEERAKALARAAALEDSIAQMEDEHFRARVGPLKVSQMTVKEKAEFVRRRGLEPFLGLLRAEMNSRR